MKRRGAKSGPFSLFSFQDVMASVIGMLFFVVLIMAMSIVDRKAAALGVTEAPVSEQEFGDLQHRLANWQAEIESLRKEIRKLSGELELVTRSDREVLDDIKQLHAKLRTLYALMEQEGKDLTNLAARGGAKTQATKALLEEMASLEQELAKTKAILASARPAPKIAYIVTPELDRLEPWLLEVSGTSLRVASKDGASTVLDFTATSSDARAKQFLAWAKSQKSRSHYFVVLTKPSGVNEASELIHKLKGLGFEIGTDLLPESWAPF